MKLQCSVRAQMKDFSKLFETIMDFKGLSFLVTEQSLMKKQRPVFFLAIVISDHLIICAGAGQKPQKLKKK